MSVITGVMTVVSFVHNRHPSFITTTTKTKSERAVETFDVLYQLGNVAIAIFAILLMVLE